MVESRFSPCSVRERDGRVAFEEIDAICRRSSQATSQQYFIRALARLMLGDTPGHRLDLERALHADAADLDVLDALLAREPWIALAALGHPRASDETVHRAAHHLLGVERLVFWAERTRAGFHGILVFPDEAASDVLVDGRSIESDRAPLSVIPGLLRVHHLWRPCPPGSGVRIVASARGRASVIDLPPAIPDGRRASAATGAVTVVVPIFGGREATRGCLAALSAQRCSRPIDVVLIDDASPDDGLAEDVRRTASDRGWTSLRNPTNLGFAASVNSAVRIAKGADLLLLNADAILPPDGIDRLLLAAEGPEVGTVVPFSNDGGFTSFPRMRISNPVPDEVEAYRIDAACRAASHSPIDIPAGTAFCMLVTGACWDAVGGLDLDYRRGYFEDVDFCLRAKRRGFRNVLAPDVYVRHLGGQSFGGLKRSLVADNSHLLIERFPDYDAEWMPFVEADILRGVRGCIERRLPPLGPVRLIAGQGASLLATRLGPACGVSTLCLSSDRERVDHVRGAFGEGPASLSFGRDDGGAYGAYLRSLRMVELILADPSEAMLDDLEAALSDTIPVTLILTGPRALQSSRSQRRLVRRARLSAIDAMGRSALGLPTAALPEPSAVGRGPVRVAALAPKLSIAAAQLIHAFDRRLRPRGGEVIVFGAGLGNGASPRATGAMDEAEYPVALVHRAVTHAFVPDAETPFAVVERLRTSSGVPVAFHDWSSGRHPVAAGDLALAEGCDREEHLASLEAWCMPDPVLGRAPQ